MSDSLHPMDYPVHGILQARILEWVAFPFSKKYSESAQEIFFLEIYREQP